MLRRDGCCAANPGTVCASHMPTVAASTLKRRDFTAFLLLDGLRSEGEGDAQIMPAPCCAASFPPAGNACLSGFFYANSPEPLRPLLDNPGEHSLAFASWHRTM